MSRQQARLLNPVFRRRRIIWVFIIVIILLVVFRTPWELPPALKIAGIIPSGLSRANVVSFIKGASSKHPVDEIYGLLHFVTRNDQLFLTTPSLLDPSKPISLDLYAGEKQDWEENVKALNENFPIVLFSKTYCPYSKNARELLQAYNLHPPLNIVEVDLRDDGDLIQAILFRLTKRRTVPNIVLRGQSIGGFDEIRGLHDEKKLVHILEDAKIEVNGNTSGR